MRLSLFLCEEQTGGLDYVLSAQLAPGDVCRVTLSIDGDLPAVYHDGVFGGRDLAPELAVHGVILQHIGQVVCGAQVVDAYDLDLRMADACAENHTADPAEAVDANSDTHKHIPPENFWASRLKISINLH